MKKNTQSCTGKNIGRIKERNESGAHSKAYTEAWDEIDKRYARPTDEEYLRYAEEEKRRHFDSPQEFCLNALYPIPQDIIDKWSFDGHCVEGYISKQDDPVNYTRDGYRWCVENWGTKWDVCGECLSGEAVITKGENFFSAHFETARNPPVPWLKKVAGDFKELRFEFSSSAEYGLDHDCYFCGMIVMENGPEVEIDTGK